MATAPNSSASLSVNKALEVELCVVSDGGVAGLKVQLSRLQAQRLADTLRAFALGSSTKAVGTGSRELFIVRDTTGKPDARAVVYLRRPPSC